MTPIISGTTRERIVRSLAIWAMVAVFSGWFLYDGYIGWPHQNLTKAVEALDPVPEELPPLDRSATPEAADALRRDIAQAQGTRHRLTRADVEDRLGAPGWRSTGEGVTRMCYFGPAGMIRVTTSGDLATEAEFVNGKHDPLDLKMQLILGYGLLPVSLFLLIQVLRAVATRVVLDDHGLKIGGKAAVPYEAMVRLESDQFKKKGVIDLVYQDRDAEKKVRLDEYVIREFAAIVTEICNRRSFPSPMERTAEPLTA